MLWDHLAVYRSVFDATVISALYYKMLEENVWPPVLDIKLTQQEKDPGKGESNSISHRPESWDF